MTLSYRYMHFLISISSNMNKEKCFCCSVFRMYFICRMYLLFFVILCSMTLGIWLYDLSKIFMLLRQSQTKYELNRSQKLKTFTTLRFPKKVFKSKELCPKRIEHSISFVFAPLCEYKSKVAFSQF